ncbi:LANO_0G17898g1_1 [Lachancea nothofagi CBS 11611]|uniref:LANO_0G17898g1_1 n=1 Tax=Lachancea nothofagi CBS 11611 TaxID=1266666 RepID=A0A1G4KKX1_9SACH|nr:LANO_0G17898g1_1 [Lachancea nothofagi CBS 11611]
MLRSRSNFINDIYLLHKPLIFGGTLRSWLNVLGITKKRLRCRNQAKGNERFCHLHTWQSQDCKVAKLSPTTPKLPGFIYIYTYTQLFESIVRRNQKQLNWLHMDYSILRENKSLPLSQWTAQDHILLKVGMTRKRTVLARLLEWESSCKHPITGLDPAKVKELCRSQSAGPAKRDSSLARLFQKLSISRKAKPIATTDVRNAMPFHGFRDGGFYVANGRSLEDIESGIHRYLWKRFGQGLIYCHGCKNEQGEPKRHKEWFLVPIAQVPDVFKIISAICNDN